MYKLMGHDAFATLMLTLLLPILTFAHSADAAAQEGAALQSSIVLAESPLQLNGVGARTMFFIRVYVAKLYLSNKAHSLSAINATPGPKRLSLHMQHKASPEKFNDALMHGIEANTNAVERAEFKAQVAQLSETILAGDEIAEGDVIDFDYLPEIGTVVSVNGNNHGSAIPGAAFYHVVLRIFVGDKPVDQSMKEGLLDL